MSVTVNWCAHIARRKRTHGAKRSINLLQKDMKYIFRLVVVLWSVDLLSDHWSKSKILSTDVRYEGIFYSPQKRISQLSDYREWENVLYHGCTTLLLKGNHASFVSHICFALFRTVIPDNFAGNLIYCWSFVGGKTLWSLRRIHIAGLRKIKIVERESLFQ